MVGLEEQATSGDTCSIQIASCRVVASFFDAPSSLLVNLPRLSNLASPTGRLILGRLRSRYSVPQMFFLNQGGSLLFFNIARALSYSIGISVTAGINPTFSSRGKTGKRLTTQAT